MIQKREGENIGGAVVIIFESLAAAGAAAASNDIDRRADHQYPVASKMDEGKKTLACTRTGGRETNDYWDCHGQRRWRRAIPVRKLNIYRTPLLVLLLSLLWF